MSGARPARVAPDEHPALRVVRDADVDLPAAEEAVADLLRALGKDPSSTQQADTPRRLASAFAEMITVQQLDLTTLPI
jgi:GTP cyclohydrolase I